MHETVYERRSEREGDGRLTQALWEEMETCSPKVTSLQMTIIYK